ncbi:hypothetical protein KGF57_002944 [Candida theae]|uniref:Cytochrome P450 n=1 Tax=Candida theae TaxID=1198502 RepID=A0AAD5BE80_9ASCO|nr:uncharacterized protein KGF57_002944 [Candida theae]KAI5957678.1 hypothetical protein KGF57_002944 [Candida theae]
MTYKRKKRAVSQLLNSKSISSRKSTICDEIDYILGKLVLEVTANEDIDLATYLKYFTLRCSVFLMYGLHLDCFGKDHALCDEIIRNESEIIRLRSPISNIEDSVTLLRYFPKLTNAHKAVECGQTRNGYMNELYARFQEGAKDGNDNNDCTNSFVGQLLAQRGSKRLSEAEIYSICLTFISAGLDNTPLNLNYLLGILSQPVIGQMYQSKAIHNILDNCSGDVVVAWEQSGEANFENAYVHVLVLETLRHFTVLPLSLPRTTTKPFLHGDVIIPANTHLFLNAYAANNDEEHFESPLEFWPERWLDERGQSNFAAKINQHFSFGAGSRMCSGSSFALYEMYVFMVKFLLLFEVHPPDSKLMITDPFANNGNGRATSFEPRSHHVKLIRRQLLSPNEDKIRDVALRI